MQDDAAVLAAEREFFSALIGGRVDILEALLAQDFTLVALDGAVVSKAALLEAVGSSHLRFHTIDPVESQVRFYDSVAVVTGRTRMCVQLGGNAMEFASRYTHVFAHEQGKPVLVAAQGTPIQAA